MTNQSIEAFSLHTASCNASFKFYLSSKIFILVTSFMALSVELIRNVFDDKIGIIFFISP